MAYGQNAPSCDPLSKKKKRIWLTGFHCNLLYIKGLSRLEQLMQWSQLSVAFSQKVWKTQLMKGTCYLFIYKRFIRFKFRIATRTSSKHSVANRFIGKELLILFTRYTTRYIYTETFYSNQRPNYQPRVL